MTTEPQGDQTQEGNLGQLTDEAWLDAHTDLIAQASAAGDDALLRELTESVVFDPARRGEHLYDLRQADRRAGVRYLPQPPQDTP